MFKAIYLFFIFKFAPKTIDSNACRFWRRSVSFLNEQRDKAGHSFCLWHFWRIYLRDPYAIPMGSHWTSSNWHPVCWKKI